MWLPGIVRMDKWVDGMGNALKWTVFRAATSQPSDCMTMVAILLPT